MYACLQAAAVENLFMTHMSNEPLVVFKDLDPYSPVHGSYLSPGTNNNVAGLPRSRVPFSPRTARTLSNLSGNHRPPVNQDEMKALTPRSA